MRISSIHLSNFKRFSDLRIEGIPKSTKLVVLVGPNGSGKTSVFEAFNHYYKWRGYLQYGKQEYLNKANSGESLPPNEWYNIAQNNVKIEFHDMHEMLPGDNQIKGKFYFRTAFRNDPDFTISTMTKQIDPLSKYRFENLMVNDSAVSSNYQKMIAYTVGGIFDPTKQNKLVKELAEELYGIVRCALEHVFEDLTLSSMGDPLVNGSFYFTKGKIENFHYSNLSAGEKAALDLILDLVIQSSYYLDAIYCIDEPEAHMHTMLQGKVLKEIYQLVPETSQLWIATHSFGMLKAAEEIEKQEPGTVVFLDFSNRNFDASEVIRPSKITRAVRDKFYELAMGDYSKLLLPKTIVLCEGDPKGGMNKSFDRAIYTTIFEEEYPDVQFISVGSSNDVIDAEKTMGDLMKLVLKGTEVIKVIDKDDRSVDEIEQLKLEHNVNVLSRRNIESYLLDDEIIGKLCDVQSLADKKDECLRAKENAINNSIARENPVDDIKSASRDIYRELKRILKLTGCGNSIPIFLRNIIAPLITPDTTVYKELKKDIFGDIK